MADMLAGSIYAAALFAAVFVVGATIRKKHPETARVMLWGACFAVVFEIAAFLPSLTANANPSRQEIRSVKTGAPVDVHQQILRWLNVMKVSHREHPVSGSVTLNLNVAINSQFSYTIFTTKERPDLIFFRHKNSMLGELLHQLKTNKNAEPIMDAVDLEAQRAHVDLTPNWPNSYMITDAYSVNGMDLFKFQKACQRFSTTVLAMRSQLFLSTYQNIPTLSIGASNSNL